MDWPAAVARGWHPVARASDVTTRRPLPARLMGQGLVLFRSGEDIAILHDRCPHRGVPLSRGRLRDGAVACAYHGWRFAADGRCIEVPGANECPAISAGALPAKVVAGLVWTSLAEEPPAFPLLPDALHDGALDRFWWKLAASEAGLLDALENHLDPAHPHIVHPWLVRAPHKRRPVAVTVRTGPWGGEAIYREQRRNAALLPGAMEGRRSRSIGRLWPPTIGEVRLESDNGAVLSIAVAFAPEAQGLTRPWAHFASTRGLLPAWFKRAALKAFHWPVLTQDRAMLRLQHNARAEQDAAYTIGPLDVLSRAIWLHARGEPCAEETRELTMLL